MFKYYNSNNAIVFVHDYGTSALLHSVFAFESTVTLFMIMKLLHYYFNVEEKFMLMTVNSFTMM